MKKKIFVLFMLVFYCFVMLGGCGNQSQTTENHNNKIENVSVENENYQKKFMLKVYNTSLKKIVETDLEEYICGVVAGEMFNYWENEALKAQAILARTYTMYFVNNCKSKYDGADISTDITEAQAYDTSQINEKIKNAVAETKDQILTFDGEPIRAWFHSNSGGKTTSAKTGLNFADDEPEYILSVSSPEDEENSKNFSWKETFTKTEILNALRKMGVSVANVNSFKVKNVGVSDRVETFEVGGKEISATTFRLNIGSTKMKSTFITDIKMLKDGVEISGLGYGHGVGMSQWGAQIYAKQGKTAYEILNHYFKNVKLENVNNLQ